MDHTNRQHGCFESFDDIRPYYDKGDLSILVLIDFCKSFDCVDHTIRLDKLYHYFGFSIETCWLLHSYLTDRTQFVSLNKESSTMECRYTAVPQWLILIWAALVSIFINAIVMCCKNSSIHLYADDVQMYLSRPIGLIDKYRENTSNCSAS